MGSIRRTSDDDRLSTADREVQLAITDVIAEAFGNAVEVALSPNELTATQRRLLCRPAKKLQVRI